MFVFMLNVLFALFFTITKYSRVLFVRFTAAIAGPGRLAVRAQKE